MKTFRITDDTQPGRELVLTLDPYDWYDEDEPEVDEQAVEQILEFWCGDLQRGYIYTEDGGYIAVVDATDGKCLIQLWSQETSDDTWPLDSFPFRSLTHEEINEHA